VQERAQIFHSLTVHAKIAMAETRRGAHGDEALGRALVKLKIVDKPEKRAATFGVEIIIGLGDDPGSRQIRHRRSRLSPAIRDGNSKLKRRNRV
jgi:chorismate-pyruvate lyase